MSITRIQLLRGTSEALAAANEVLLAGEMCIETDTGKYKIGDGSTAWNDLKYGGGEVVSISNDILSYHNAGAHNALYRGKNLGSTITEAQSAAIRAGTFEDIYPGDYWEFSNVAYSSGTYSGIMRVADLDYYLRCGNTELATHHIVIVPDAILYSARMNATETTAGGYVGSEMYTTNLAKAKAIFTACFGEDHILTYREKLVNAVTNGRASGTSWYDSTVELMDECMVYGSYQYDSGNTDGGSTFRYRNSVSCKQLNIFRYRPDLISNRQSYWLRNIVSDKWFARLDALGFPNYNPATYSQGVRPAALIY